jgi:hypothetical protein
VLNIYKTKKNVANFITNTCQPLKKKLKNPTINSIVNVFSNAVPYRKYDPFQEQFVEDFTLYIIKRYHSLSSIKNVRLRKLVF